MGTTSSKPEDFTIGGPGSDNDRMSAAVYRQESNELRIEKLGNRITIISVIIPCLICAILLFAYMDVKERMVNVHDTGQTEVLGVAEEFDTKINAMTVDLAEVKHRLETTLNSLESETARLTTTKAERSELKAELAQIEKNLTDRTSKTTQALESAIKKNLEALEIQETRISENLAKTVEIKKSLARQTDELEKVIQAMKAAVKAEQSRTAALEVKSAEQNEAMALVQKELSLVKIKTDTLEQTFIDRKVLDRELNLLDQKLDEKIAREIDQKINQKIDRPSDKIKGQLQAEEEPVKPIPIPAPSPRQPKPPESISEKDLLQ